MQFGLNLGASCCGRHSTRLAAPLRPVELSFVSVDIKSVCGGTRFVRLHVASPRNWQPLRVSQAKVGGAPQTVQSRARVRVQVAGRLLVWRVRVCVCAATKWRTRNDSNFPIDLFLAAPSFAPDAPSLNSAKLSHVEAAETRAAFEFIRSWAAASGGGGDSRKARGSDRSAARPAR